MDYHLKTRPDPLVRFAGEIRVLSLFLLNTHVKFFKNFLKSPFDPFRATSGQREYSYKVELHPSFTITKS